MCNRIALAVAFVAGFVRGGWPSCDNYEGARARGIGISKGASPSETREAMIMFRCACAIVLLGALAVNAAAASAAPMVFEGQIKDVRGVDGILTLTVGEGKQAKDQLFPISEAKIKGTDGAELKVEDLRLGDRVQVEMTADGRLVRVIRVLPASKAK